MKILIIEDNHTYRQKLQKDLIEYNYTVEIANNFKTLQTLDYNKYELVIIDIGLPNTDGRELIETIKLNPKAQVIMLTSNNDSTIEYESLHLGADDYIIKPHNIAVLDLKIKKLLKSFENKQQINGHTVNHQTLKIDDQIKLTAKEYKILLAIHNNQNNFCSKSELLKNLWDSDYFVDEGALYTLVYRLRKKLVSTNIKIENTQGGYKID